MNHQKTPERFALAGGSLLNVLFTFDLSQLFSSLFLAVMGTVISYFITKILKTLFE